MSVSALFPPHQYFVIPGSTTPAAGYQLFCYAAGTANKENTYTDSGGGTSNANPIVLDADGTPPNGVYGTDGTAYKLVLAPPTDTDPPASGVELVDNYYPGNGELSDTSSSALGDALVGVKKTDANAVATTQHEVNERHRHIFDFMTAAQIADAKLTTPTLDHGTALQAALDSLPVNGSLDITGANLLVSRNTGTNDRWGVKITTNGITIKGDGSIRRYDTDISTYANAYPMVFVGTPDSNVADPVVGVSIKHIRMIGEDTRHSTTGNSLHDGRCAIEVKNTEKFRAYGVRFEKIDSQAIRFQKPVEYDYVASEYYNTTKNYRAKVIKCEFEGVEHAVANRALMHGIVTTGVDNIQILHNEAEWVDDFVTGSTTYDDIEDVETDTYLPTVAGWSLGNVKRTGRRLIYKGNQVHNHSEHGCYLNGMDVTCSNNTHTIDNTTVCQGNSIKIRARNATVSGNTCVSYTTGVNVSSPSHTVSVTGNSITQLATSGASAGAIDIDSNGLLTYLTDRSDYLAANQPMTGITVSSNSVRLPSASQTDGYGVRIYTDASAGALSDGHIRGIKISGNNFYNVMSGVYIVNNEYRGLDISGNNFYGKAFTETTFNQAQQAITASDAATDDLTIATHGLSVDDAVWIDTTVTLNITSTGTGTTLTSGDVYYVKTVTDPNNFILAKRKGGTQVNITNNSTGGIRKLNALTSFAVVYSDNGSSHGRQTTFRNNTCIGFRYIFWTDDAAGSSRNLPYGIQGNQFNFCYDIVGDGHRAIGVEDKFTDNTGSRVAGRNWATKWAIHNSIHDGSNATSDQNRSFEATDNTDVKIYTDDAGTSKAL